MNWHEVHLDDVFPAPWRNGGGTARELLAWPHKESWNVRASIAAIAQDGPFSAFPGVTRWFAGLSQAGVRLDGRRLDAESEPWRFDGSEPAGCELVDGPAEAFNLMLRGRRGRLRRLQGSREIACRKESLVGFYSHEHEIVFLAVEVRIVVPPRTLAWNVVPIDERIGVETRGALWFEVSAAEAEP